MLKKTLQTGFVLLILCGFAYAGFVLLRIWLDWLSGLEGNVLGGVLTALVGFLGLVYSQYHTKKRALEEQHRPKKVEAYEALFTFLKYLTDNEELFEGKTYEEIQQIEHPDHIREVVWELNKGLIVWSSPRVIRAWIDYRQAMPQGRNPLAALDKLIRAVRRDLGNRNFGLKRGDAMKAFLKEPQEYERFVQLYGSKSQKG